MLWLVLLLAAGIAGAWVLAQATETSIEDHRKAHPDTRVAKLAQGVTNYAWHGPEGGNIIVCIHGLSTPSYVFDAMIPGLTGQGYRVLTYDLYGRGLSDRVPGPQTREFFVRQLRELLADQKVQGPVTLCGYSMGARIALARAVEAPDTVARLILLAPAGQDTDLGIFAKICTDYPVAGDWLHAVAGPVVEWVAANLRQPATAHEADLRDRVLRDHRVKGSLQAILSSMRNILSEDVLEDYKMVAATGLPVLGIWGTQDTVVPLEGLGDLARLNRNAVTVQIPDAGHGLPVTHAAEVCDAIEDSL